MQRLKVIQILVDKVRASRIREVKITDKNLLCRCRSAPIPDQMWSECRNLCFAMICSLIQNALNYPPPVCAAPGYQVETQLIETNSLDIESPSIDSTQLYGGSSGMTMALRGQMGATVCSRLHSLSIRLPIRHVSRTLPSLDELRSLEIRISERRTRHTRSIVNLVDLDSYPRLTHLEIEGNSWSNIPPLFTGRSQSLTFCVLKGPLVVTTKFNDFFSRMAESLQYLYCHETHLVGKIETTFDKLRHLSLHKVEAANKSFPFMRCENLISLAMECDDIATSTRQDDINELLRSALLSTSKTLTALTLRSGLFWLLSPSTIHAILWTRHLSVLLLDGACYLDGRDWVLLSKASNLEVVARVEPWIQPESDVHRLIFQAVPGMVGDVAGLYHTLPKVIIKRQVCSCGLLNRRWVFHYIGLNSQSINIYIQLVADPRQMNCSHVNLLDRTVAVRGIISGQEALKRMMPLPGSEMLVNIIWPSRT